MGVNFKIGCAVGLSVLLSACGDRATGGKGYLIGSLREGTPRYLEVTISEDHALYRDILETPIPEKWFSNQVVQIPLAAEDLALLETDSTAVLFCQGNAVRNAGAELLPTLYSVALAAEEGRGYSLLLSYNHRDPTGEDDLDDVTERRHDTTEMVFNHQVLSRIDVSMSHQSLDFKFENSVAAKVVSEPTTGTWQRIIPTRVDSVTGFDPRPGVWKCALEHSGDDSDS